MKMTNTGSLIVHEYDLQTLVHRLCAGDSGGDREDDVMTMIAVSTIEELREHARRVSAAETPFHQCVPYTPSELLEHAAEEIESLQKENADLRKQIAELTVKKTQVYNPPKPSIGNFSS